MSKAAAPGEATALVDGEAAPPKTFMEKVKGELATLKTGQNRNLACILSCGLFMCCSAGMMIVNKIVTKAFKMEMTIVLIQMGFTIAVLVILFHWTLRFGNRNDVLRWSLIVPGLYAGMLGTSMLALSYSSMGAMTVVRNVAPIVTLPIERAFQEKIDVDIWTFVSLFIILFGVILYMVNDIQFSALGLALMILNMVVAILERLMQRRMIAVKPIDVSKTGMLLLNNSVGAIWIGFLVLAFKEPWEWSHRFPKMGAVEYVMLFLSCLVGVGIGWSAINAQQYVTATTMMVITNVNKFVVIFVGIAFMGEAKSAAAIIGCFVALGGGIFYAKCRSNLAEKAKKAREAAKAQEAALAKP
jgi:solute carrier family 35 protein